MVRTSLYDYWSGTQKLLYTQIPNISSTPYSLTTLFQVDKDRKELDLLDKEMGKGKTELKLLHEAIQKRHSQLEGLDKEVEREVNTRKKEIKV